MILDYLKAGYPAICIVTSEPHRAEGVIKCPGWKFFTWDCLSGIRETASLKPIEEVRDPVEAIRWLDGYRDTVLVSMNMHLFLDIPEVLQAIQNGVPKWKSIGSSLIMVTPVLNLRPEIEKLFTVVDLPLPDDSNLYELQCDIGNHCRIKPNRKAARAARGLTELEAEAAYAFSAVRKGFFSTRVVSQAKAQILRKSGLLEFWEPTSIKELGGLGELKSFIRNRAKAFDQENASLPKLKAILLVGVPGTGKSLSSKATASLLGWPLIRLDISALKNSLVGESERRMREALKVIDAFGQAVVWVDEVEKAFAGVGSNNDSGTSAAMFGTFLTWMQETTSPVLVMATANDISRLPPEFLRAGRFDAVFFVDMPTLPERKEIIRIVNRRYGSEIPGSFAEKLSGWTGAEIEQLAKDSLFEEPPNQVDKAFAAIVPLSRIMREEINSLREWARTRARFANTPETEPSETRKVRKGPRLKASGPDNPILN
jgi:hypothetical protein